MSRVPPVALALAAVFLPLSDALPQPAAPRSVFAHVYTAYSSQILRAMDGYLVDNVSSTFPGASVAETGDLGPTLLFGGEAGYMMSPLWSLGISVSTSGTDGSVLFGSFIADAGSNDLDGSMIDLTATASIWTPGNSGFFAGVEAGAGFGKLTETFEYTSFSPSSLKYRGEWNGTCFVGGVFAGFHYDFSYGLMVLAKGGYKHRNPGTMGGETTITESTYPSYPPGVAPGPITDSAGRALESDFSCSYLAVGLGWRFAAAADRATR